MRQQTIHDTHNSAGLLFASAGRPQTTARKLVEPFNSIAYTYCSLESAPLVDGELDRTLRMRSLGERLLTDGASEAVVKTLSDRFAELPAAPACMAMFVDGQGGLLHEARLTGMDMPDSAGFGAPPNVRPLLAWHQCMPAHIVVAIDRAGADLSISPGRGEPSRIFTITGPDDEIEHNAPGGWAGLSGSRFENRAEDSWHHNAGHVARTVVEQAAAIEPEVVILTGDVRMLQMLEQQLPQEHPWQVRTIAGGRSADGSQAAREALVAEVLRDMADQQDRWLLDELRERLSPGGLGVAGAEQTLAALAANQVAVLVVSDDLPSGTAWFGESGTDVFFDADRAHASGVPVRAGALADVAVRAALLTGARVRVVKSSADGMPTDGIGALCRYS